MKLEIAEDLQKRIEYFAALYKKSPAEYLLAIIDRQIPAIPDAEAAIQHLQDLIDGKYAEVDSDEEDFEEYMRAIGDARVNLPATLNGKSERAIS